MDEADLYVRAVVASYRVVPGRNAAPERVRRRLLPVIGKWAGANLESVSLAGSYIKGTAIRSRPLFPTDTDVDLFLSLRPEMPGGMAELYASLAEWFGEFTPRPRNVAVRILVDGTSVDLVPGRRREGSNDHTLWQNRHATWLQTNIEEQARFVKESGATDDILAAKIWRRRHGLRFPSYCLELAVIRALSGAEERRPSARLARVLEFLAEGLAGARITDPANSNNVVTDGMEREEKMRVAEAARRALRAQEWTEVL